MIDTDLCPDCIAQQGLCGKDRCRRAVLPQLAKPALVRLIGDSLTEQTKRQTKGLTPKERTKVEAIGRRNARRQARQKRGPFALLRAIARA